MTEFDAKVYRKSLIFKEKIYLEVDKTRPGQESWSTRRAVVADLARPYINDYLGNGINPKILEIGAGRGNAATKMLSSHLDLKPEDITLTSVVPYPEHEQLKALGVEVYTGVIAEALPKIWTGKFQIVLGCLVFQHTIKDLAIPEIHRVLTPEGVFLGLDGSERIVEDIGKQTVAINMLNLLKGKKVENLDTLIPFAYKKVI